MFLSDYKSVVNISDKYMYLLYNVCCKVHYFLYIVHFYLNLLIGVNNSYNNIIKLKFI